MEKDHERDKGSRFRLILSRNLKLLQMCGRCPFHIWLRQKDCFRMTEMYMITDQADYGWWSDSIDNHLVGRYQECYNISGGNVGLINHPVYIIKILLVRTSGDLVRLGLKGAFLNDIAYAAELVANQNSRKCCWSILTCSWSGWFLHVYMLTWRSANLFCELCVNHHFENWNKRCALKCCWWLFVTCCASKEFSSPSRNKCYSTSSDNKSQNVMSN